MQILRELRDEKLDFWLENNLNVLIEGHYGTGKTTRILQAFERRKLKYKYFSAATMDPWCDFIGIPKVVDEQGSRYLDYILPKDFQDDSVEAIYMDEFNRSHKKVRNAVMELLQFKSINGRPFKKLKVIWAAINPEGEDEQYQVEPLDKAQKDRFHVQVSVPYKPSLEFFSKRFPLSQAKTIINWWEALPAEQQMQVSPRRLEYALDMFNLKGGDLKDVIPHTCNPSRLNSMLNTGPVDDKLKELFTSQNADETKKFLQVENNYAASVKFLTCNIPHGNRDEWSTFFLPALPPEKLSSLVASNDDTYQFVVKNGQIGIFSKIINDILKANTNRQLVKKIRRDYKSFKGHALTGNNPVAPYFKDNSPIKDWETNVAVLLKQQMDTTPQRAKVYDEIEDNIPSTLTAKGALDTLELLNLLASRSYASSFGHQKKLLGIINHCISQLHKQTTLSWHEMLSNYGPKLDKLIDRLRQCGKEADILQPTTVTATA